MTRFQKTIAPIQIPQLRLEDLLACGSSTFGYWIVPHWMSVSSHAIATVSLQDNHRKRTPCEQSWKWPKGSMTVSYGNRKMRNTVFEYCISDLHCCRKRVHILLVLAAQIYWAERTLRRCCSCGAITALMIRRSRCRRKLGYFKNPAVACWYGHSTQQNRDCLANDEEELE